MSITSSDIKLAVVFAVAASDGNAGNNDAVVVNDPHFSQGKASYFVRSFLFR